MEWWREKWSLKFLFAPRWLLRWSFLLTVCHPVRLYLLFPEHFKLRNVLQTRCACWFLNNMVIAIESLGLFDYNKQAPTLSHLLHSYTHQRNIDVGKKCWNTSIIVSVYYFLLVHYSVWNNSNKTKTAKNLTGICSIICLLSSWWWWWFMKSLSSKRNYIKSNLFD